MDEVVKKYSNGEVSVVWKPSKCIHSTKCWKGLSEVFDPRKKPWITLHGSTTEKIIEQVKKCPSGALTFQIHSGPAETVVANETIVETTTNGPLVVYGNISVRNSKGDMLTKKDKVTAFCRCGASSNKPYCDGTHKKIEFIAD
jgi:uncharacterized Fe-S cluster protein YjdI